MPWSTWTHITGASAASIAGTAETLDAAPLLAQVLEREGSPASAALGLAALVEGRLSTDEWLSAVRTGRPASAREAA